MIASDSRLGVAFAFSGGLVLSFDTLLLRLTQGEPLQVAFWRGLLMFVSGLCVWSILRLRGSAKLGLVNGPAGLVVAALYGLASIFFVAGAMLTNIANMLVIIATTPLWAAIAAFAFFRETTPLRTWLAFGVALTGIVVVVWPALSTGANAGDAIALLTAWSMAGALVFSHRSRANLALAPATGGLISAVVLSPFVPAFSLQAIGQPVFLLLEGAILVPLALGLIAMAPRYLPGPQVGLFLLLETVLGPAWIWAGVGEKPTMNAQVGGVVVVLALLAHSARSIRSKNLRRPGCDSVADAGPTVQ